MKVILSFIRLFLLSLYEGVRPKRTHWFFHDDLTLDLILWPAGFFLIGMSTLDLVSYHLLT